MSGGVALLASSGMLAATAAGAGLTGAGTVSGVEQAARGVLLELEAVATGSEVTLAPRDLAPGFEPVPPEPELFDVTALTKSVAVTQRRMAEAREAARSVARSCRAADSGFGRVRSWVADAGNELRCRFDVDDVYGVAGRAGTSDHPRGLALDLMVDREPGENLATYAVRNMKRLGIEYVIYRQRINYGSGWQRMEDRGGLTANHMDHVHVSFQRTPPLDALA